MNLSAFDTILIVFICFMVWTMLDLMIGRWFTSWWKTTRAYTSLRNFFRLIFEERFFRCTVFSYLIGFILCVLAIYQLLIHNKNLTHLYAIGSLLWIFTGSYCNRKAHPYKNK